MLGIRESMVSTADLSEPLGKDRGARESYHIPFHIYVWGLTGALLGVAFMWTLLTDDPVGGEPKVVLNLEAAPGFIEQQEIGVTTEENLQKAAVLLQNSRTLSVNPSDASEGDPVISEIDAPSGEIKVIDPSANIAFEEGDALEDRPIEKLIEKVNGVFLPRVATDGTQPMDAYARPVPADVASGTIPRIAIIVGGLGLSQTTTMNAVDDLPPEITLAFSPYGNSLSRWQSRARMRGFELLLQVPLEPYDYPNNDPGPETLLADLSPGENIDRLHRVMAQITNYVGLMSYMGGRFTADEVALEPFFDEVSKRGLLFLDEGTSARSVTVQTAERFRLPAKRADVVLDAIPSEDDIQARLIQLEALARERGYAVATASAYPLTIEMLASWARLIEGRGLALVPISAVIHEGEN